MILFKLQLNNLFYKSMSALNNEKLKQYMLIGVVITLLVITGSQLYAFFPGLLGAITMYILMRKPYFHLTVIKNWKKWVVSTLFIVGGLVVVVLPFYFLIRVLIPRFTENLSNGQLTGIIETLTQKLENISPQLSISQDQVMGLAQNLSSSAPLVLGATFNMLTNTVLAFFILYFMLTEGRRMEQTLHKYIPLKEKNIDDIWTATHVMVKANAIGIPMLALVQAIVAAIGYKLFGISSYILWGVLTGVCSVVPVVGTAVIWVPLCIYLIATGNVPYGIALMFYSLLITGTVDNILRFTILKKLGDVHPVITALGILVGIPIFGFMGFIFGPLLISLLFLLIKIYRVEFASEEA